MFALFRILYDCFSSPLSKKKTEFKVYITLASFLCLRQGLQPKKLIMLCRDNTSDHRATNGLGSEGLFYCLIFFTKRQRSTKGKRILHIHLLVFQEKGKKVYTHFLFFILQIWVLHFFLFEINLNISYFLSLKILVFHFSWMKKKIWVLHFLSRLAFERKKLSFIFFNNFTAFFITKIWVLHFFCSKIFSRIWVLHFLIRLAFERKKSHHSNFNFAAFFTSKYGFYNYGLFWETKWSEKMGSTFFVGIWKKKMVLHPSKMSFYILQFYMGVWGSTSTVLHKGSSPSHL